MKKFIAGLGIAILTLICCSAFLHLLPKKQQKPVNVTYRITYQTTSGEAIESFMFKENGSYPTSYKAGKTAHVDDLKGRISYAGSSSWWYGETDEDTIEFPPIKFYAGSGVPNPNNPYQEHEFWGWYLDKEMTKPFDGEITAQFEGDIVLYADIVVTFWTKFY